MASYFVGDIGTVISVDAGTTISGATGVTLEVSKPNGTTVSWNASVAGQIASVTVTEGDFDVSGVYLLQIKLTMGDWVGRGNTAKFTISKVFE